ncbi:MAG: hypothetical protein RR404_00195 [Bacilli bacterium]
MLDDFKNTQPFAYEILKKAITKNSCSHAYIIESNGADKALEFALSFSKCLFCPHNFTNNQKCSNCFQCQIIDDKNFLELKIISADGMWIKKAQLEELQLEFQKKSIVGNKKIYIINDAEKLNLSSANSILKFLEDPESGITAILIVNNIYQLLPTIVSRCQVISLNNPIETDEISFFKKNITTLSDEELKQKIDICIDFVKYYEENGYATLAVINKKWFKDFKDKENISLGLDIMILFYQVVLKEKLEMHTKLFNKYINIIDEIKNNNSISNLFDKINVILDKKEKIKLNMNSALLMDKLIIELERKK